MILIAYLDNYTEENINYLLENNYNIFINFSHNINNLKIDDKYKNKLWFSKSQYNEPNCNYIEYYDMCFFPEQDKNIIINNYNGIITRHIQLYEQMFNATRRYGLIINGRLKCYEENFIPVILIYLNENKDDWIDVHINLNEEKEELSKYLIESNINYPFIKTINCNKYNTDKYYLNFPNNKCENPSTLMSSYYTLMKGFSQLNYYRIVNKIEYDLIIKYRPDIIIDRLPDFKKFMFLKNCSNEIYTPHSNMWGYNGYKMNDQIGIGNFESMNIYCSIYSYIDNYLNNKEFGLYHPETLLANHLKVFNINVRIFDFNYSLNPKRNNLRLVDDK